MIEVPRVLVVGGGGIGTIAALNLYTGDACHLTMVLRSSYDKVIKDGFTIDSIDHGNIASWKPHAILQSVPSPPMDNPEEEYDFVVCCTKNLPDISPTLRIIRTAITPAKTTVVLLQNGINIEKPFLTLFPQNIILSGVSYTSSHETSLGVVKQTHPDELIISAFANPNIEIHLQHKKAQEFVQLYSRSDKTDCRFSTQKDDIRWRKLIYNATFNPVCAILGTDTGALRRWEVIQVLIRPAMTEIVAVAKMQGIMFEESIIDDTIRMDEESGSSRPSMAVDVSKGNALEVEVLLGEIVREADSVGAEVHTLRCLYHLCKGLQQRTLEARRTYS